MKLLCCLRYSYGPHPQLYLDENGKVDVELTKSEAERIESAKRNESRVNGRKRAIRKRRSQAQNMGTAPTSTGLLDSGREAFEATEFEGWVFSTFKDCKVGEFVFIKPPFLSQILHFEPFFYVY